MHRNLDRPSRVLLGVGALIASITFGVAATHGEEPIPPAALAQAGPRVAALDSALGSRFAVLTRPSADLDAVARESEQRLGAQKQADSEASASLTRRVAVAPSGTSFAVPSRDGLCITVLSETKGSASTCMPQRLALKRGVALSFQVPGSADSEVFGIAPDGVREVRFSHGGRNGHAPVIDNGYYLVLPAGIETVEFVTDTGAEPVSIPNPPA